MAKKISKPKEGESVREKKTRKKGGEIAPKDQPFHKYFSITVFSLTLFVLFAGYMAWHVEKFNIVKSSVIDYYGLITLAEQDLQREIWVLTTDTLQISDAHSNSFEENTDKKNNLSALEEDFMSLARLKPFYSQISMLDMDGKEIIRVNGNNGNPIMDSLETLQDKSNYDYFQKARSLEKGAYYLSGLILKEEFGLVERPLKPVIQAAAPLVDASGTRNGVIVVTFDAANLLIDLKKRLSQTKGILHIVRPNGSWVIAPEDKQLWSDQLGHGQTFELEYGSIWPELLAKPSGVAVSDNTAFAFFRIRLSPSIPFLSQQINPQKGSVTDASTDLIFISIVQTPALLTWILENERAFSAGAGSTLILISLVSLMVSYPLALRQQEKTRRKKDQAAYFQDITATMADALIVIDSKGCIHSINRAGFATFGYSEQELLGKNITLLMGKSDAAQHETYINNYLGGGESKIIGKLPREVMGRHKSGKPIALELAVAELQSSKQTLFIGSLRDVTEKKRAEARAKKSEEQFRLLAEHGNDIIFLRDAKGRIIYVSPSIKRHLGLNPEKQVGKYGWDLLYPNERKEVSRKWQKVVVEEKKTYKSVGRIPHKNGKSLWFESITEPIKDSSGKVTGAVTTSRNISELRAAEDRSLRLGRIIEDSLNEIYVFDEKTLKFAFANRGARENLGYTLRELQKLTPVQIKPKFTAKSFAKILEPLRTGEKEKIYFETQHRRKDKSLYEVEVHLQLSRVGTEPVFVAVIEDITDRKTADEMLKQAQKMEAIGNLSGGIAHDFNNLLTAIQGSIQLLKSFAPDLDENAKECLDIAYQSSKRGSDLTHRLLAFSRKQSLKPEVTELNALVKNLIPLLRRTIDESIEINNHFSEKDLLVKVDTHELENSILNLAVNARDAMEEGGHLTFEISETDVTKGIAGQREIKSGHYAVLSISDTGYGMPPEVQEKVFEPFFTTKEVGKGTGLGLSMVYGFIKQSGGHITVYSEPDQGTTIKLYLKTTQEQQEKRAKKKQPSDLNVKETGTILLVEDDKGVRKFIIRALKAKGYEVLAAQDGPSALKIMEKSLEIDLLLTDVVLPKGMDGPAIAKVFKQEYPTAAIIFSSGYTGRAIKNKDFLKKGDELLSKPYDLETLFNRVRNEIKPKKSARLKKANLKTKQAVE